MNNVYRKKIQRQIDANNLLSDRLRATRKEAREREAELLIHIKQIAEDNSNLLTKVITLQSALPKQEAIPVVPLDLPTA